MAKQKLILERPFWTPGTMSKVVQIPSHWKDRRDAAFCQITLDACFICSGLAGYISFLFPLNFWYTFTILCHYTASYYMHVVCSCAMQTVQVVTLNEAKALLKVDDDLIIAVYDYWLNKRLQLVRCCTTAVLPLLV